MAVHTTDEQLARHYTHQVGGRRSRPPDDRCFGAFAGVRRPALEAPGVVVVLPSLPDPVLDELGVSLPSLAAEGVLPSLSLPSLDLTGIAFPSLDLDGVRLLLSRVSGGVP